MCNRFLNCHIKLTFCTDITRSNHSLKATAVSFQSYLGKCSPQVNKKILKETLLAYSWCGTEALLGGCLRTHSSKKKTDVEG